MRRAMRFIENHLSLTIAILIVTAGIAWAATVTLDYGLGATINALLKAIDTDGDGAISDEAWLTGKQDAADMSTAVPANETDPIVGAITGIVLSDGAGNISAASAGTDYLTPSGDGTSLTLSLGGCSSGTCTASEILGGQTIDFGAAIIDLDSATITFPAGGWFFADADGSPSVAGQFRYDNTVTGLDDGAIVWYDDDEVKYFLDYATLPTLTGQVPVYNATSDKWVPGYPIIHKTWSFDPDAVCDGAVDRLFLMTAEDGYGNDFVVDRWKVSFEADPTTEADLDLKRADAFIGVANSAVMDVLDTTNGASSETTAANINSGAAVANGKVIYLEFGTAYTETTHQVIFEMWGHYE